MISKTVRMTVRSKNRKKKNYKNNHLLISRMQKVPLNLKKIISMKMSRLTLIAQCLLRINHLLKVQMT